MDKKAQGSNTLEICSFCQLRSVQKGLCQFCEHVQDSHPLTQETNCSGDNPEKYEPKISCKMQSSCHMSCCQNIQPLEPSAGPRSGQHVPKCVRSQHTSPDHLYPAVVSCQHAQRDQRVADCQDCRLWRAPLSGTHGAPIEGSPRRAEEQGRSLRPYDSERSTQDAQQEVQETSGVGATPEGTRSGAHGKPDHSPDVCHGRDLSDQECTAVTTGHGWLRPVSPGLTYGQVMQDHPQYCQWVITTSKETDTCWRLARLATWLMSTNNQEHAEIPKSSKTKNVNKTAQLGHKASGKGYPQESAASEPGSWTQCSSTEGDEMQRLKDELEVLRQENLDLQQQMGRGKSRREM